MERIGNYRIDAELSRSETGAVYEARHLVLPRRAILKVSGTDERPQPARVHAVQLLREACILEALEHPGVVRVYESGLLPDRRPWFARERIDGASIEDLLAMGPLEPVNAVAVLRDLAGILEHAHRRGVVHCDLRPDRIVIAGRSRGYPLCIVDWTHARVHDTSAPLPDLEVTDHAAPELIDGTAVDDRADIFAMGVIAYRVLTGGRPFTMVTASGERTHVPTAVRCPEAPPELTNLVDQMLASERFDRPSSAEVHAELTQLAHDLVEPPVAVAEGSASGIRIRRPRWTPSLPLDYGEPDLVALDISDDTTDKAP